MISIPILSVQWTLQFHRLSLLFQRLVLIIPLCDINWHFLSLNQFIPSGLFYLDSLNRSICNRKGVKLIFITITKTRLYNFDPTTPPAPTPPPPPPRIPPAYSKTGVYRGGYTLFFLFLLKNIDCDTVLTSTHNLCFEQKYGKITEFLFENLQFLWLYFQYIWIGLFS